MTKDAFAQSVVVAALALLWTSPGMAQTPGTPGPGFPATSFLAPTKATWDSVRTLVLGIADSMPEDKYDFKPTPAVRTFREVLIHLIGENYTFSAGSPATTLAATPASTPSRAARRS